MPTYHITPAHNAAFTVDAFHVNMAVHIANREAKERSVLAGKARMDLITDHGERHVGTFDLDGHTLPQSWGELQRQVKDTRARAMHKAKHTTTYPCHRSRGAVLTAEDDQGNDVVVLTDELSLPKTLHAYREAVQIIRQRHPSVQVIWAECGVDSAASVHDLNEGLDYEIWTGEGCVLLWHRDHPCLAN